MKLDLDILCDAGVHCNECRSNSTWRNQVAEHFEVPTDWPACPRGIALGSDEQSPKVQHKSCGGCSRNSNHQSRSS